jgi:Arc/MetJ-type ribon-helix-helix transcriptional regulator
MVNKLISVRLTPALEAESKSLVEDLGFSNLQEFMRAALIEKISAWKREKALAEILKLRGSAKGNASIKSKKELSVLAKEFGF